MAAMAVIGGIEAPEKPALPEALRQPGGVSSAHEQALLAALETGTEAEALEAIRGLAALGGELNRRRFAAIMNDRRWVDALRTEAARALLATGDAAEAVLAVRALGVIGGAANTEFLDALIADASLPQALRLEAALGLGTIGTAKAGNALIKAFGMFSAPEVHEQLLGALGHFPFPQIEATWRQFLADPNTSSELRVAAVDALANSTAEALPFLKTMAGSDPDPEVREMSAWAISAHQGENAAMGQELARMASAEPEADVRRRLYEALPMQANNPAESILPLIHAESDIAARVAGFNALGDAVNRGGSLSLVNQFDQEVAPELIKIALSPESLNIRLRAVIALRRANTFAARQALQVISQTPTPQIAQAARQGLRAAR